MRMNKTENVHWHAKIGNSLQSKIDEFLSPWCNRSEFFEKPFEFQVK